MRAHSNDSTAFNYMHLSAAHLEELIVQHGMLERSDDAEILERNNRTAKRIKEDLVCFGGSSDRDKAIVERVEFKSVKDNAGVETREFEEVGSQRKRVAGQWEQFARLMNGRKLMMASRKERIA
eukprot:3736380-Pleurochrysis_carterae.AAC.1